MARKKPPAKPKDAGALPRAKRKTPAWVKAAADRAEGKPKPEPILDKEERAEKRKRKVASAPTVHVAAEPKTETAKPKMGRPSTYKPEYAGQAVSLCELGATDPEIAKFFKVHLRTISKWRVQHPDFGQALKTGKAQADERVERSLYQRAIGYEQKAVKIFMPAGASEPVYAPYVERIQADTTAAIFWLKNRRPEAWRDVNRHEHTGKDGKPIETEASDLEIARRVAFALVKGERSAKETVN